MSIRNSYQERRIRFVELVELQDWSIKVYSIAIDKERVSEQHILLAKQQLNHWLQQSTLYELETYRIATLIVHEGREGCFAIVQWWIDENMLQNFVYLKPYQESSFKLISDKGLATCVWEMAIWWFERNAWVQHILKKPEQPDWTSYLNEQLNIDC